MKCFVQRTRHWVGILLTAGGIAGTAMGVCAADRPPASDEPWPAAEPRQVNPDPAARPIRVITTTASQRANRAPANRGVAPAAAEVRSPIQPVGSGVRSTASKSNNGRVRTASAYRLVNDGPASVLRSGPTSDEVFEPRPGEAMGEIVGDEIVVGQHEHGGEGPWYYDDEIVEPYEDGDFWFEDSCASCGFRHGIGQDCCLIPCPPWGSLQAFAGTQGFTGPLNIGETGSFGFYEGVNYGSQLPWGLFPALGWQVGGRFTQSDLSGSELTSSSRHQSFLTAGLFRRAEHGLQMGVVFDYLNEDWYGKADLNQVRAELAWVYHHTTEYGVWVASAGREKAPVAAVPVTPAIQAALNTVWQPTDLYAAYVRRYFGAANSGQARCFAGGTGQKDGLLGADVILPMTDHWSFQAGFTYLIPEQSVGTGVNAGHSQESWNVTFGITWVPGRPNVKNMYRPLLNVADNGSFLVDRK